MYFHPYGTGICYGGHVGCYDCRYSGLMRYGYRLTHRFQIRVIKYYVECKV